MSASIELSTIRLATTFMSLSCGIVSKYAVTSASITQLIPSEMH